MNLTQDEVLKTLESVRAVIVNDHFVYTSGRHGSSYVNKDAIYPHTNLTARLCEAIAHRFQTHNVQVVVAPAVGGVILSQWTAHHLAAIYAAQLNAFAPPSASEVLGTYAEKADDGSKNFVMKRGYERLVAEKNVLIVEDVINTGGSVEKVIEVVREHHGNIVGVGALCNRGGLTAEVLNVPKLDALIDIPMNTWEAASCPFCQKGTPINTEIGKGREFLAKKEAAGHAASP